jgi:hypothetical protein
VFTHSLFAARPTRVVLGLLVALTGFGSFAVAPSPATAADVAFVANSPEAAAARAAATWAKVAMNNTPNVTGTIPTIKQASANTGAPAANAVTHSSASAILADTQWGAEPCQSSTYATGSIYQWKVPPGCYAGVYTVNPRNFVARSSFGWCNWWPEVLHPHFANVIFGARHSTPVAGAVVVFAPGVQGAGSAGHYGEVVAVLGHGWILISEMNNSWRGGFARVTYRYVYQSAGVSYIY